MGKRRYSVSTHLIVAILPVTITLFLVVLISIYTSSKQHLMQAAQEECQYISTNIANKIEQQIKIIEQTARSSVILLPQSSLTKTNIFNFLQRILQQTPHLFGTSLSFAPYSYNKKTKKFAPYVYKKNGKIYHRNLANGNYFNEQWFSYPQQTLKSSWGRPYFDNLGGKEFMLTYSAPFFTTNSHQFLGVFTLDVSLKWLIELANSIKLSPRSVAFIIDQTGTFIAHPNTKLIGKVSLQSLAKKLNQPYLLEIAQDIKEKRSGFRQVHPISIKEVSRFFYAPIPGTNWSIGILFPESDLYRDLNSFTTKMIVIMIASIILLLLIILVISYRITAPLKNLTQKITKLHQQDWQLDTSSNYSQKEIAELYNSFIEMQQELQLHIKNIIELNKNKQKIESELKIAQEIQNGILQKIFPPFPEISQIDIFATILPAKSVGGDLYDFFLHNNRIYFIIGDVSGKGIPASLYMAITITLLRANRGLPVEQMMNKVNSALASDNPNMMFTTLFIGAIDLNSGILTFCNAGHCYPIIYSEQHSPIILKTTHGPALGVMQYQYSSSTFLLNNNDKLLLYTDGLTEAHNLEDQLFGEQRFLEIIQQNTSYNAQQICALLEKQVKEFMGTRDAFDDLTLLSLIYNDQRPENKHIPLVLSGNRDELSLINQKLTKICPHENLLPKAMLIAEEIFINIISYAVKNLKQPEIKLDIRSDGIQLIMTFIDNGPPFNPLQNNREKINDTTLQERPVGGLGIELIKKMSHSVDYLYIGNHNILTITLK